MLSSTALYTLVLPKAIDFLQKNVVLVSSPKIGSNLFEIPLNNKNNVKNLSEVLYRREAKAIHWKEDELPTTLILELFLICNVRKIVLDFDLKALPSSIELLYSVDEKKLNFKRLKILRDNELKRTNPFVIYLTKPLPMKYFKIKLNGFIDSSEQQKISKEGEAKQTKKKCILRSIRLYGSPALSGENLYELYNKNQDKLKALVTGLTGFGKEQTKEEKKKTKDGSENKGGDESSTTPTEEEDKEEGITIEILPDDETENQNNNSFRTSKL
ncbi:hypothetical protein ABK040_006302 [Willaertia magna]